MKSVFFLALSALVTATFASAHALDCAKASLPVEKLFCATPELKRADEAMSAAYFKLLRETKDPDFHEALVRSQRRWLEVRSHGPDRFGAAAADDTDDREVLLKMTRDRLAALRTAEPLRTMQQQRKIAAADGGGRFAGYDTFSCLFMPPPYGNWNYICLGAAHRQHGERVCSVAAEWASGHATEDRTVSVLKNGAPRRVANCSAGYGGTARCPEPDDDPESKAIAHWNSDPKSSDELPRPRVGTLWKYDPDTAAATDQPWMTDCLFASTYPPPEAAGAKSSPAR